MAKQNSRLSTSIVSADGGEKRGESFSELCTKKESAGKAGQRKGLALLLANEKAMGPFLDFLKSTEVGGREGARGGELEWQRRSDQAGEELHGG